MQRKIIREISHVKKIIYENSEKLIHLISKDTLSYLIIYATKYFNKKHYS